MEKRSFAGFVAEHSTAKLRKGFRPVQKMQPLFPKPRHFTDFFREKPFLCCDF
jgi:hypothetical protein